MSPQCCVQHVAAHCVSGDDAYAARIVALHNELKGQVRILNAGILQCSLQSLHDPLYLAMLQIHQIG